LATHIYVQKLYFHVLRQHRLNAGAASTMVPLPSSTSPGADDLPDFATIIPNQYLNDYAVDVADTWLDRCATVDACPGLRRGALIISPRRRPGETPAGWLPAAASHGPDPDWGRLQDDTLRIRCSRRYPRRRAAVLGMRRGSNVLIEAWEHKLLSWLLENKDGWWCRSATLRFFINRLKFCYKTFSVRGYGAPASG
jgi:hypothetical protein